MNCVRNLANFMSELLSNCQQIVIQKKRNKRKIRVDKYRIDGLKSIERLADDNSCRKKRKYLIYF